MALSRGALLGPVVDLGSRGWEVGEAGELEPEDDEMDGVCILYGGTEGRHSEPVDQHIKHE